MPSPRSLLTLAVPALLFGLAGSAHAQAQAEFHQRGGLARTGEYPVSGLPVAHEIAWKTVLAARDPTTPAVADGIVVVGERTGTGLLTALDLKTGRVRWQTAIGGMQDGPTISQGVVYGAHGEFTGGGGHDKTYPEGLFAKDLRTGKDLWHRPLPLGPDEVHLAAVGATLYVNVAGDFLALDARTGGARWTYRLSPRVDPAVKEVKMQVGTADMNDYQRAKTEVARCTTLPAVDQGTVYLVASPARIPLSIATVPDGLPTDLKGSRGWIVALDAETGREKWRAQPVPDLKEERDFDICNGQPMVAGGVVVTRTKWTIYALDARDGRERWRLTLPVRNREELLRGPPVSQPLVTNDLVITRHNGFRGFSLQEGRLLWERPLPANTWVSIASGFMYFAGFDDAKPPAHRGYAFLYAYDLARGEIAWKREVDPAQALWKRRPDNPQAETRDPDFVTPVDDGLVYAASDGMRGIVVRLR